MINLDVPIVAAFAALRTSISALIQSLRRKPGAANSCTILATSAGMAIMSGPIADSVAAWR